MTNNFITTHVNILSSKGADILKSFQERLAVNSDNHQDQNDFGKLIDDNIASKVRMNINSKKWLKGDNNPKWCIVEDIHIDLNQISLKSAANAFNFGYLDSCSTALLYLYHECNLIDETMEIETRSQDELLGFIQAEFVQGKIFYGTSSPITKKKTWWDSNQRKDWKGDTIQNEIDKHNMKNIHEELIPHIQNIFFKEQRELLKNKI